MSTFTLGNLQTEVADNLHRPEPSLGGQVKRVANRLTQEMARHVSPGAALTRKDFNLDRRRVEEKLEPPSGADGKYFDVMWARVFPNDAGQEGWELERLNWAEAHRRYDDHPPGEDTGSDSWAGEPAGYTVVPESARSRSSVTTSRTGPDYYIRVWPDLSDSYKDDGDTLRVFMKRQPDDLTKTEDTNWVLNLFPSVIVYGVSAELGTRFGNQRRGEFLQLFQNKLEMFKQDEFDRDLQENATRWGTRQPHGRTRGLLDRVIDETIT